MPKYWLASGRVRRIHGCLSLLGAIYLLTGCAAGHYAHTDAGTFYGQTNLEWKNSHEFVFHQSLERPFYFERANGDKIIPPSIYTDGGSIPRPFWILRGYSPWEYGPAFIIHDWLFVAHQCHVGGYEKYTLQDAAQIMSECIKTLMEEQPTVVDKNPTRLYRMNLAVKSFVAKHSWNEGECRIPPEVAVERKEQTQARLKRGARASRRMRLHPKKKLPATGAPIHERALDRIIQAVPVP